MLDSHFFRPSPKPHIVSKDRGRSEPLMHSPRQNQILAMLPHGDFKRLISGAEEGPLPVGSAVYGAGEPHDYLYFLTEGIVCRIFKLNSGMSSDFAIVGHEGVIGIAAFLGGESTQSQALTVSAGYAYRLPADLLKKQFERGGVLQHLLLRYTQALIAQAGRIAVCNRHHNLEQRLCMWILLCLDRLPSNELILTQEKIAEMLGVRREGVTQAAGELQQARLIHYGRGRITLVDRPRLEARSCECYAAIKREYERLLPCPDSSSGTRLTHPWRQ